MRVLSIVCVGIYVFDVYFCCLWVIFVVCCCASVVFFIVIESVGSTFVVGCDAVVCVYDVVGVFLGNTL